MRDILFLILDFYIPSCKVVLLLNNLLHHEKLKNIRIMLYGCKNC